MSQTQSKYHVKMTTKNKADINMSKLEPGTYTFICKDGVKVLTKCGNSKVEQQHRTEIKKMVADAESRGLLRASVKFEGELDDFPEYDFQEAQMRMADANSKFYQLPSGLREKYDNDPAKFMDDVKNATPAKLKELGLLKTVHDNRRKDGTVIDNSPPPPPPPTDPNDPPA
jgi:hypothetical protein